MKKIISMTIALLMVVSIAGCGSKETPVEVTEAVTEAMTTVETTSAVETTASEMVTFENLYPSLIVGETESTVTYVDKFGVETTITKAPKKVAVVYNSLLGLWYYMGGTSLTKVKGTTNVPEEAMDLVDLGTSYSVSLEALIAFEPDLVVMSSNIDSQVAMAANLNEMGVETMIIDAKTKSYESFAQNAYLFSKVLGTEDLFFDKMAHILEEVEDIIIMASTAENHPRVAPLFATSKSMSLETDVAQIGEIVSMLGGENIYSEKDLISEGETRIPFSIEAIVTQNPEVILISTMGDIDSAKAVVEGMISENPVWDEVDAVKNNRVFYLDKDLSVYKPNERYAEAFQMVAEKLYPELFPTE